MDLIDDAVIVVNEVGEQEAESTPVIAYVNNQFADNFSTCIQDLTEDDVDVAKDVDIIQS